ncbi:NAD(P)-dependent alcohol dehydrogenase [Aromatoleum aromaticum]|uniref:Putative 4-isopropylbenzyl alcohol dehydrogenase n=1 Tax=Aromatoleum aromaticum TaxID=551760 RepID=A0A096ZNX2_9RHOO|nr:NAD(P)-dependent alcohol dehydrogenase [Aromatoleum aromaticum]AIS23700.1 putative 4-isopropylbenzyl alcohol dehydrogenase [Aromatoleum aromaticum]NMG55506.1 alcohol dehydrogenase catalytic domain-containing protein [Aromatoleum aromaticum]
MGSIQDSLFIPARAAVLRAVGGPLEIEDVRISPPKGDEVLVRMVGVGVCHTDVVCRDGFPVPLPIVLGHEGAGIVEAVGERVTKVKPGQRVVLSFNSCGHCSSCGEDHPATCHQMLPLNFGAAQRVDGGCVTDASGEAVHSLFFGQSSFCTFALAREVNTVPVGDGVPLEILGPLGCGIQTGAGAAINSLAIKPGQSLAIFGGGSVGLSALLGALAVGAGPVVVVEPNDRRRALALDLGASHVFDPFNTEDLVASIKAATGGGVTHSLDSTGLPPVIAKAIDCTLPGGTVGLLGVPAPDAAVPVTLLDLLVKSVTLRPITEGDANPQEFIPRMVQLYRDGKFPFDKLITTYRFENINDAFKATETGEAIKPVLVF